MPANCLPLPAEDEASDEAKEQASMANAAGDVLTIAESQGYPPCIFTRRALGMTD